MDSLEPVSESGGIPRKKKIPEAEYRNIFPYYLLSFNARIFCVLAQNSPIRFSVWNLPAGLLGGEWWAWCGFFFIRWVHLCLLQMENLHVMGGFEGGSIGKIISQPFCKNACLLSLPLLHFSLVRLDSIRLWFYLPCVGDGIWQDDVMNI